MLGVKTISQAPSYASPKLLTNDSLTGVKCRATSVAKKDYKKMTSIIFVTKTPKYQKRGLKSEKYEFTIIFTRFF